MLDHAEGALELARKHSYRAIEADALRLLGDVFRNPVVPDLQQAERNYLKACEICVELGLRPEQARCQIALGQLLKESGRFAEADRLFDSATRLIRSMDAVEPFATIA